MSLTPEQIEAGWVEHDGGPCPVEPDDWVHFIFRDGDGGQSAAHRMPAAVWKHLGDDSDIIAYRLEPKP